jgi:adenylate cyclase
MSAPQAVPSGTRPLVGWVALAALPLVLLGLVLAEPAIDRRWESHPAHFWLVLAAAAISVALGWSVLDAARTRRDARLLLVALAFVSAASFLGLHALATPGVLLGRNAGFELATPVGLVLAAAFAAASGLRLGPRASARVVRAGPWLFLVVAAVVAGWAAVSLAELWPLSATLGGEELDGWQLSLAAVGVALFLAAAAGYFALYRRRRTGFLVAVALAFALLADAMLVIAWARNWQLSWWEWHVIMLAAFGVIALAARVEWHEERFSPLYLDETAAGARDVSVLFADLVAYTTFAEGRSPAEVAAVLNTYFDRLVPLLEEVGGEVHEIIGDAIMVVFNKSGDQPDHAIRAARAALLFQAAAADLAREHPDWPRFRLGLNTGPVLAGIVGARRGHRKHGVIGDTVNVAARLETHAPPGKVVIGGETARRIADGAVLERLPALRVKGKQAPVDAYLLHSLEAGDAPRERGNA